MANHDIEKSKGDAVAITKRVLSDLLNDRIPVAQFFQAELKKVNVENVNGLDYVRSIISDERINKIDRNVEDKVVRVMSPKKVGGHQTNDNNSNNEDAIERRRRREFATRMEDNSRTAQAVLDGIKTLRIGQSVVRSEITNVIVVIVSYVLCLSVLDIRGRSLSEMKRGLSTAVYTIQCVLQVILTFVLLVNVAEEASVLEDITPMLRSIVSHTEMIPVYVYYILSLDMLTDEQRREQLIEFKGRLFGSGGGGNSSQHGGRRNKRKTNKRDTRRGTSKRKTGRRAQKKQSRIKIIRIKKGRGARTLRK